MRGAIESKVLDAYQAAKGGEKSSNEEGKTQEEQQPEE